MVYVVCKHPVVLVGPIIIQVVGMHSLNLKAGTWSKVEIALHFANFNESLQIASLVRLLFHELREALMDTL